MAGNQPSTILKESGCVPVKLYLQNGDWAGFGLETGVCQPILNDASLSMSGVKTAVTWKQVSVIVRISVKGPSIIMSVSGAFTEKNNSMFVFLGKASFHVTSCEAQG